MTNTIPVEAVAALPVPGTALPSQFKFSPDNQWITYLDSQDGSLTKQLYRLNLESGESELLADAAHTGSNGESFSLEETLRRERLRQHTLGITQYAWNQAGQILIPLPKGLFILDQPKQPLRELISSENGAIQNGRFSPNGKWVAFVQNDELHIIPTAGGAKEQLTFGAQEQGKTNGLAEYIAQEEMGRSQGFWWSPNSQSIAYAEVDEQHIPIYRIMHQGKDEVGASAQEDHRYPFAGMPNAKVRLAVVDLNAKKSIWLELGSNEDIYLARVGWAGNGRLMAQLLNREQTELRLISFDPATGKASKLLKETSDIWINLHNHFRALKANEQLADGGFIWASEKNGFRHLYLHNWQGEEIRPLTSGEWLVDTLVAVDQEQKKLYFTATKESPTEKHLYCSSLNGGEIKKISQGPGFHQININISKNIFIDIKSDIQNPYSVTLNNLEDSTKGRQLFKAVDSRIEKFNLKAPQMISFKNRTDTLLYGAIYHPPAQFGKGPFPTIISVYGGPHAQRVTNQWLLTADMRAQFLSQHGFLVFKCDNRGSARRGLSFEGHIKHDMGNIEVDDQVDGVQWLVEQGLTDPARVGIYGWSYGGYMALMGLARAGDVFKTAVSGAPVTHWDGYDTCYTERYMGMPQSNPEGYKRSNVMHHVHKITGNLMIIHGLIDENVHFRHTARLINALIKARKPYDLRLFPNERHSPRGLEDRIFMEEQVKDYFVEHL